MATAGRNLKSDRLYLRVSPRQREVIAEAAEVAEKDVTSFVLDAALVQAQRVIADRRAFRLDGPAWRRFVQALDRPTAALESKPRLERLLREPGALG